MFIVTAPKYEFGAGVSITNRHILTTATMIKGYKTIDSQFLPSVRNINTITIDRENPFSLMEL